MSDCRKSCRVCAQLCQIVATVVTCAQLCQIVATVVACAQLCQIVATVVVCAQLCQSVGKYILYCTYTVRIRKVNKYKNAPL